MARPPTVRRIAACAAVCAVTVAALGPTGYRGAVASSVGGGALGGCRRPRTGPHLPIVGRRQLRQCRDGHVRRVRVHGTATSGRAVPPAASQPPLSARGLAARTRVLTGGPAGLADIAVVRRSADLRRRVRAQPRDRGDGRNAHAPPGLSAAAPRSTARQDRRLGRASARAPVGRRAALQLAGGCRQAAVREAPRPPPRHVVRA